MQGSRLRGQCQGSSHIRLELEKRSKRRDGPPLVRALRMTGQGQCLATKQLDDVLSFPVPKERQQLAEGARHGLG